MPRRKPRASLAQLQAVLTSRAWWLFTADASAYLARLPVSTHETISGGEVACDSYDQHPTPAAAFATAPPRAAGPLIPDRRDFMPPWDLRQLHLAHPGVLAWDYGRLHNPTCWALKALVVDLEGGARLASASAWRSRRELLGRRSLHCFGTTLHGTYQPGVGLTAQALALPSWST